MDPTVFKNWEYEVSEGSTEKSSIRQFHISSTDNSLVSQDMIDFLETNHYSHSKEVVEKYKQVKSLSNGSTERKKAYIEFQQLVKKLKLVNVKDKQQYLESIRTLERSLSRKT